MAVVMERQLPGGGCVRIHNDFVPKTEAERAAADLAFELTVANLISTGQIKLDGVDPGDTVIGKLIRK